jgi:hypothetical protein
MRQLILTVPIVDRRRLESVTVLDRFWNHYNA